MLDRGFCPLLPRTWECRHRSPPLENPFRFQCRRQSTLGVRVRSTVGYFPYIYTGIPLVEMDVVLLNGTVKAVMEHHVADVGIFEDFLAHPAIVIIGHVLFSEWFSCSAYTVLLQKLFIVDQPSHILDSHSCCWIEPSRNLGLLLTNFRPVNVKP